jgi:hypothetical protein
MARAGTCAVGKGRPAGRHHVADAARPTAGLDTPTHRRGWPPASRRSARPLRTSSRPVARRHPGVSANGAVGVNEHAGYCCSIPQVVWGAYPGNAPRGHRQRHRLRQRHPAAAPPQQGVLGRRSGHPSSLLHRDPQDPRACVQGLHGLGGLRRQPPQAPRHRAARPARLTPYSRTAEPTPQHPRSAPRLSEAGGTHAGGSPLQSAADARLSAWAGTDRLGATGRRPRGGGRR